MSIKKSLGKGLEAYFDTAADDSNIENIEPQATAILEIDINKIEPNRSQPRKSFDEKYLNELADSLKEFGVIQPIILKKEDGYYSIIAGERRWRAARIARLATIPAIIKDYSNLEALETALIENIQRLDLNPIEEASCYKRLIEEYQLTQDVIAQKVGKNRSTISNALRLLNLDPRVQNFITEGRLTTGHARALLPLEDYDKQFDLAERIIEDELSVRSTETLVKSIIGPPPIQPHNEVPLQEVQNSSIYKSIERDLNSLLGTRVLIKNGKNKGKIEIEYFSDDDLDRIVVLLRNIKD